MPVRLSISQRLIQMIQSIALPSTFGLLMAVLLCLSSFSVVQTAPVDNSVSSYEFYPYSGQQPQLFLLQPYYSSNGYTDILSPQFKRSSGSAVKRERIVMDAMGGDYLIRKRTF